MGLYLGSSGWASVWRNEQEPDGGRFAPKEPLIKGGGRRSYKPKQWAKGGNQQYPGSYGNHRRLHELGKDLRWGSKQARKLGINVDTLMCMFEEGMGR